MDEHVLSEDVIDRVAGILRVEGKPYVVDFTTRQKPTNSHSWRLRFSPRHLDDYMAIATDEQRHTAKEFWGLVHADPGLREVYQSADPIDPSILTEEQRAAFQRMKKAIDETPENAPALHLIWRMPVTSPIMRFKTWRLVRTLRSRSARKVSRALLDESLSKVRGALGQEPVTSYISFSTPDTFVVAPTSDKFDILRIEETFDNNGQVDTEGIIRRLEELDDKYSFDVVGAGQPAVEIQLGLAPTGSLLTQLEEELLSICPYLYEQTSEQDLARGRVVLWWD